MTGSNEEEDEEEEEWAPANVSVRTRQPTVLVSHYVETKTPSPHHPSLRGHAEMDVTRRSRGALNVQTFTLNDDGFCKHSAGAERLGASRTRDPQSNLRPREARGYSRSQTADHRKSPTSR